MANGVIAEGNVVAIGNNGLIALVHRERNKVIGLAVESTGNGCRHSRNHPLELGRRHTHFAGNRIADAIRGLRDRRLANDVSGLSGYGLSSLRHKILLTIPSSPSFGE